MTKSQRYTLLIDHGQHVSLWTLACQANGWSKSDRAFRVQKISEIMGREIASTSELNNTTDVTRLFTFLRAQTCDLTAAVAMETPGFEHVPQHRYVIEKEILPCLALYVEDLTGYVATILADAIRHYKTDRPTRPPSLSDLTPAQLHRALMTLSARLNAKRRAAGDTIHDMKTKAGLECNCAGCGKRRRAFRVAQPEPAPAVTITANTDPDWTV